MKEFIKKLIGRLEEEILTCQSAYAESIIGMCGKSAEGYMSEIHAYEKTKKIVNQLAEEYINCSTDTSTDCSTDNSNDGCEWDSDFNYITGRYKRNTQCGYTFYDLHHAEDFKICPYCGKKIKIAPYQPKGE